MTTLTIQPDEAAGLDTWLFTELPNSNYGTHTELRIGDNKDAVGQVWRALIKFDLSDLPDAAVISSATLSLWCRNDHSTNTTPYYVFRQKRAWVELEATWNEYSTGNSWQLAGGYGVNDCEHELVGQRLFTGSEVLDEFKHFPLTPTTKAGLDLGNGWLIRAADELNSGYRFCSSSEGIAAHRPKLVIEYTSAGAGRSWGVII